MGLGDDLLMESIKKNNEEIAKKQASGEKLSFSNWLVLLCQIGFLLCSIALAVYFIGLMFSLK